MALVLYPSPIVSHKLDRMDEDIFSQSSNMHEPMEDSSQTGDLSNGDDDETMRTPTMQCESIATDHVTPPLQTDPSLNEEGIVSSTIVSEPAPIPDDVGESIDVIISSPNKTQQETLSVGNGFGGLSNLGNTCYMASALQMLVSIDGIDDLFSGDETSSNLSNLQKELMILRNRLSNGDTVVPENFKKVVDERTSMFLGFRQQDAHEFLTTLMELLDDDFHKTHDESNDNHGDSEMHASEADPVPSQAVVEMEVEEPSMDTEDTTVIRMGLKGGESASSVEIAGQSDDQIDYIPFSKFGMEEIASLLHGTYASSNADKTRCVSSELLPTNEPNFKLVGGRMNPGDSPLTRYTEGMNVEDEEATVPMSEGLHNGSSSGVDDTPVRESPLAEQLTTEVCVRLTCDSCKYSRSHVEKYWHLSLEIGSECGGVDEGLRRFFAPEKREVKCEKCFSSSATQTSEITRLPKILLFHFKRFIVDVSPDYTSVTYRKNRSPVYFDDTIEVDDQHGCLRQFLNYDCRRPANCGDSYSIRSVVNHIGSSASCGHYTADALRNVSGAERKWVRFNDAYVTDVTKAQAMEQSRETAYMVIYELPTVS